MNRSYKNFEYSLALFVIWPFGMFIYALKNYFSKNNQLIILAFSFLYGYSVFFDSGGDILRYKETYEDVTSFKWNDYFYLLTNAWSPDKNTNYVLNAATNKPDVFALSLSFIISRFTDNPRWFWAFLSLIYTFLVLNFINTIRKETHWINNSFTQRIFFVGLVFVVPFYVGVTGVRFWPALFIFTTYATLFSYQRKLKYLILAASSILFHYSFFVPFLLLILSFFIPRKQGIYKLLIIISVFIFISNSISSSLGIIKNLSSNFEETSIEEASSSYTDEENLNERVLNTQKTNWYVRLKTESILYFLLIIGILDVLGVFRFNENNFSKKMYPLMFIFLILTLLTKDLGSISRFRYVFYLLILSRYTILAGIQPLKLKLISYIFLPILVLYIIVSFRAGFYTVEPTLLLNNMIAIFFTHSDVSLSEFLIGH